MLDGLTSVAETVHTCGGAKELTDSTKKALKEQQRLGNSLINHIFCVLSSMCRECL